ncbi:MAG: sugar phosphate isomerase/epimerase family protein [Planctomycetaceae bacterium]
METNETTSDANNRDVKRRDFLRLAIASGLATVAMPLRADDAAPKTRPKVCTYTEHFQELPIPEVCKTFREMGVDGLDLTVRPGGHIAPENVKAELPEAATAARDHGLEIMMLTTAITSPDDNARAILETCQKLNIQRIKLGYYPVGEFGKLSQRLDDVRRQLDAVADLAAKYDVRPCVHVHSGGTIPSNGFMLHQLIRDIPPDRIGAYLDSHHMTITGGAGGWSQAIDLLTPWISLVALKNFQWEKGERDEIGQQQWRTQYCPLADGIAPIPDFVRTVHDAGYRGFYTLHTEYHRPVGECIQLTTADFAYLKTIFARLDS